MRKYNFIMVMFILLCSVKSWGQDIVNLHHIVQRGETIEILADKYRLTTDILKAVNLGMDTFYTGMEVLVPVDKKYMWLRSEDDSETILKDIAGYFSEYQEASRVFNTGDYKKQINSLNPRFEIMGNICHAKKPISEEPCVITIVTSGVLPSKVLHRLSVLVNVLRSCVNRVVV